MSLSRSPTLSIIVTVFNKAAYLPDTLASLFAQTDDMPAGHSVEYIFVDDLSSDNSLGVIESLTQGMENVTIIRNTTNVGPSIRLNQGAKLAKGAYLQFFDSDDIMPRGTSAFLYRLLTEHNADMVYGRWEKTNETGAELLSRKVNQSAKIHVSDTPLITMLKDSFSRMTFMTRAETFVQSGGADERIFIQDESIPIRLASVARRLVTLEASVLLVPRQEVTLSSNKSQLNHDRFLANALHMEKPRLDGRERQLLYRRSVSAFWKQIRQDDGISSVFSWIFIYYIRTRIHKERPSAGVMNMMRAYMQEIEGVRRVAS